MVFGEIRDTVSLAGRVYDIEVDDVQRAFWVAYRASITYYPWYNEQVGKSVGGLLRFQSLAATGSEVSRGGSVIDIALSTQCAGSGRCLVACWHYFYWNEVHVVGNEPRYASGGYRVFGADGEAMSSHGVKAVSAPGGQASLGIRVPAPMADLTGDGVPEIVFSYSASQWRPGTPSIRHDSTQIVTVGNDVPLWELGRSAHSSVWQVDADGLPDVLLHGRTETIGYQGYTGLPLFVLATQRNLHPVTTGALKAGGGQRGVLLSLDTLLVYHFDFGTLATRRFTPTLFTLHPNYPNPFNPSTTVSYTLHFASYVKLTVFDVLGRRIRILEDNTQASGDYSVDWDGTDQSGQQVASGVYFIRLTASNQTETRKAVLVR